MGTPSRHVVIVALATLGLTCVGPTVSAAQDSPASALGLHKSTIRTVSPILRKLVGDASERSQTFLSWSPQSTPPMDSSTSQSERAGACAPAFCTG